jgi:hypothetical protein
MEINPFSGVSHHYAARVLVVHSAHLEMGEGPYHGLATLVAEELGADWARMVPERMADGVASMLNVFGGSRRQRARLRMKPSAVCDAPLNISDLLA